MPQSPRGASLPLVTCESSGLYIIHPQARNFLLSLPQQSECHVLSIVGKVKTGKSFLLNRILEEPQFATDESVQGCTRGINISTKYLQTADRIVIVLDSEGFGSTANTVDQDCKLFLLAFLLSSTLLFNSFGSIDEQTLTSLSLVVELGKIFEKSLQTGTISPPNLCWVLRDFCLQMESQSGEPISPNQYLERALEQRKGVSNAVTNKNRIRRVLKALFPKRMCSTLPVPAEDVPIRSQSPIRKEFERDFVVFSHQLIDHIGKSPKLLNGRPITVEEYILCLEECVRNLNSNRNGLPVVDSIYAQVNGAKIQKHNKLFRQKVQEMMEFFEERRKWAEDKINGGMSESRIGEFSSWVDDLEAIIHNIDKQFQATSVRIKQLLPNEASLGLSKEISQIYSIRNAHIRTVREATEAMRSRLEDVREQSRLKAGNHHCSNICLGLSLAQSEEALEFLYRNSLKQTNQLRISERELYNLKMEVAYLNRKLLLRSNTHSGLSQPNYTLGQINPEEQVNRKHKFQSLNETKSFYVPYFVIGRPNLIRAQITRTLIKENNLHYRYVEYVLQITVLDRKWSLRRKWRDFCELNNILHSMFPQQNLPICTSFIIDDEGSPIGCELYGNCKKIEQRREQLERYLRELLDLEGVRNSRIMQKFVKINKEYFQL